jgi:hypothetical protein
MYEEYDDFHPFTAEQKDQLWVIDQELEQHVAALLDAADSPGQEMLMRRMSDLADARAGVMGLSEQEISILNGHPDWRIEMIFDSALEDALGKLNQAHNLTVRIFGELLQWKLRRFSYHVLYRIGPEDADRTT